MTSVFAPLAFATGRTGRLFIEFALTLAGAVLVSGFIALTLSPMMCSLLLKHEEKHSWLFNLVEGWLQAMTNGYRAALTAVLHARWVVAIAWLAVLGAGAVLFMSLKSELAPIEDRGVVFGVVTAPQGSTPQYTADQIKPIEQFYAQIPEAAAWTAISGFPTVVDGNAVLRLKPWEERKKRQQQIADELRPKFAVGARRDRVPDQSAVARPVVPLDADRVRHHVADPVRRTCSGSSTASSTRRASTRACRTCRPTCASTRRKCACASTATSCPTSACRSTPSAARSRRCSAGGR